MPRAHICSKMVRHELWRYTTVVAPASPIGRREAEKETAGKPDGSIICGECGVAQRMHCCNVHELHLCNQAASRNLLVAGKPTSPFQPGAGISYTGSRKWDMC